MAAVHKSTAAKLTLHTKRAHDDGIGFYRGTSSAPKEKQNASRSHNRACVALVMKTTSIRLRNSDKVEADWVLDFDVRSRCMEENFTF